MDVLVDKIGLSRCHQREKKMLTTKQYHDVIVEKEIRMALSTPWACEDVVTGERRMDWITTWACQCVSGERRLDWLAWACQDVTRERRIDGLVGNQCCYLYSRTLGVVIAVDLLLRIYLYFITFVLPGQCCGRRTSSFAGNQCCYL